MVEENVRNQLDFKAKYSFLSSMKEKNVSQKIW